jgi:hypothetical protein
VFRSHASCSLENVFAKDVDSLCKLKAIAYLYCARTCSARVGLCVSMNQQTALLVNMVSIYSVRVKGATFSKRWTNAFGLESCQRSGQRVFFVKRKFTEGGVFGSERINRVVE